jgi:hypothetical protein
MRDPDLVMQAQRAATALELAWDRYRTLHGLGSDPMPAISSYVGYSLEEPWGEPRVVLGVAADEAEHLAVLLDRHDCARPGSPLAEMGLAAEPEAALAGADQVTGNGHVHVPAQPQPPSAKRARAKEQPRPERPRGREQARPADQPAEPRNLRPLESGGGADNGQPRNPGRARGVSRPLDPGSVLDSGRSLDSGPLGPGGGFSPPPPAASYPVADLRAASQPAGQHAGQHVGPASHAGPPAAERGAELMAFRPRHEPASYLDQGPEPDPFFADPDEQVPSGRIRGGRVIGSHAMPRQKRPGAPAAVIGTGQRAGRQQEGSGGRGLTSVAAELAGWASGELPGQAAHRFAPAAPGGQYGPASDSAAWPNGGLPADRGI